MRRPQAVVFDLGGVLIDWDPRYLYRKLLADEEQVERFIAEVTTAEWNNEQDRGRPFAEAVAELSTRHPEHAELIAAYHERWREMLGGPIEPTVALLRALKERGDAALYALTNWSAETFPIAEERYDFLRWFDGILVSGREGVVKPDTAIFSLLCERFAVPAEATLFIDDAPANVQGARDAGLDAVRYTTPEQLRADLAKRGLLDPSEGSAQG